MGDWTIFGLPQAHQPSLGHIGEKALGKITLQSCKVLELRGPSPPFLSDPNVEHMYIAEQMDFVLLHVHGQAPLVDSSRFVAYIVTDAKVWSCCNNVV